MALEHLSDSKTTSSPVVVQNGTIVTSSYVMKYVERYRSFVKQTAQSLISLAETLAEAKAELQPDEFSQFCAEVGIDPEGSTCRKLKVVGENAARFKPVLDRVPNNWTTIYRLARLEPAKFNEIVEEKVLHASMTAENLRGHLNRREARLERCTFVLSVSTLSEEERTAVYGELKEMQKRFGFNLKLSATLSPLGGEG